MKMSRRYKNVNIGDSLEPVTVKITPDSVKNYGALMDDLNSYYSDNPDFGGPVVHSSFASILIFRLFNERFPPEPGGIHARQEFDFRQPMRIGMQVKISGKIVDKYEKKGRKYVIIEIRIEDDDGNAMVTGRTYSIVPH